MPLPEVNDLSPELVEKFRKFQQEIFGGSRPEDVYPLEDKSNANREDED